MAIRKFNLVPPSSDNPDANNWHAMLANNQSGTYNPILVGGTGALAGGLLPYNNAPTGTYAIAGPLCYFLIQWKIRTINDGWAASSTITLPVTPALGSSGGGYYAMEYPVYGGTAAGMPADVTDMAFLITGLSFGQLKLRYGFTLGGTLGADQVESVFGWYFRK